jgi:hypothetical protein
LNKTTKRKANPFKLLAHFEAEGEVFLFWIVAADETQGHHSEPETKRQSMKWHHSQSPYKKKFKMSPAGKS